MNRKNGDSVYKCFGCLPSSHKVLAMVLAGGQGTRLMPLTKERAKPAVPFGGRYRLIDFVLSNLANSGFTRIKVVTQYMADSLITHIVRGWRLSSFLGSYVEPVPAQQRMGPEWYLGTADAIYQNLDLFDDEKPEYVIICNADHVYRMDFRQMLAHHIESGQDVTVAAVPVPVCNASDFGVIEVDGAGNMVGYEEKPAKPAEIPDMPGYSLASMGNFIFGTRTLIDELLLDASNPGGSHDFGKDIIPSAFSKLRVGFYDFSSNRVPGCEDVPPYWRDVGSIAAYYQASMDLVAVTPEFNLYNREWPLHTWVKPMPPTKFVFADPGRMGHATDSLVSDGSIISGGHIHRSILGTNVRVNSYAQVDESILFDGVEVGRHAKIRRAIIDKQVVVPPGTRIGYDPVADRERFFVTSGGIVVIGRRQIIQP